MIRSSSLSDLELSAVQAYVEALQERCGEQLIDVLLFGSRARGESHPDADVDVLVILNRPDAQDFSDARGLGFDVWLTHEVFLSIHVVSRRRWEALTSMQSLFYRNLVRDGISLLPTIA